MQILKCFTIQLLVLVFLTKAGSVLTLQPHGLVCPFKFASPNNISGLTIRRTVMKLKTRLRNFNTPYTGRVNF